MLAYYLFRLGALLGPYIPSWLGFGFCDLIGTLAFWVLKSKRRAILCNLSHVLPHIGLPQQRLIGRKIMRTNLKNYFDLFRAQKMSQADFDRNVEVRGVEHLRDAEKLGKGVIAFSAHVGSFSFVPQIATSLKVNFNLTVETIKPPKLFELVRKLRRIDPQVNLIAVGGAEVRNIFRVLKQNEMVCLAIDRDVTGNGVPQKFFDREATLPVGAAEIALRTGAVCVPIHVYRLSNHTHVLQFKPGFVLEPTGNRATDAFNANARLLREVEKIIVATPDQWAVLQPIWDDCN